MNAVFEFDCPHCAARLRLKAGLQPMAGPCPQCGGMVQTPATGVAGRPGRTLLPPPRSHRSAEHAPHPGSSAPQAAGGVAAFRDRGEGGFSLDRRSGGGRKPPARGSRTKETLKVLVSVLGVLGVIALVKFAVMKDRSAPSQDPASPALHMDAEKSSGAEQRGLPDPATSRPKPVSLNR